MRVSEIHIHNFRSIDSSPIIELSNLNILIGANNAGKSSIIKALHLLQGTSLSSVDIRIGTEDFAVDIFLDGIPKRHPITRGHDVSSGRISFTSSRIALQLTDLSTIDGVQFPSYEPHHFVIPFLSKRKTTSYQEEVREQYTKEISGGFNYLTAKLSRISTPDYPTHSVYKSTCEKVLGFVLWAIPSSNGQIPGIYVQGEERKTLSIEQMGEGVPNIAAFLIHLAESKDKLFLIEELENDLHPNALKALLDLIIASSQYNQFVISTHSNIVVRHLASVEKSKLYNVQTVAKSSIPTAKIELVPTTVEARMGVLTELGYSFSDFDLWDGWLILEEASAERLIRDYLIPLFVPELTRIRTLSTGGADSVEPTFQDFNRLVRFTHLEEAYRNKGWVRVDGDPKGVGIVERLKHSYSNWETDRFSTYRESQFEKYYPKAFETEIEDALGKQGKERREAKKVLLEKVRAWLDEDRARAEAALKESAKEIIEDLQVIAAQLKGA